MKKLLFHIRFFLSLLLVATTMAVACPEPLPVEPPPPEPDSRSIGQIIFEGYDIPGLYSNGDGVIFFDQTTYQTARNDSRKMFRIQADNQMRYINLTFTSRIPDTIGQEEYCTVSYRLQQGEETTLIIKLKLIGEKDGKIWLWNDIQEFGVIIFE